MKAKKALKLVKRLNDAILSDQPNAYDLSQAIEMSSFIAGRFRKLRFKKFDRKVEDLIDSFNTDPSDVEDGSEIDCDAVNLAGPSCLSREALEEAAPISSHEEALARMNYGEHTEDLGPSGELLSNKPLGIGKPLGGGTSGR